MRTSTALPIVLASVFTLACAAPSPDPAPAAAEAPPPEAADPEPEAGAPTEGIAYYSTERYDDAALRGMRLQELALRRNTIYARAGQPFRKRWLDEHFRAQPWYQPKDRADLSLLSDTDRANAEAISKVEAGFTKAELQQRKADLLGLTELDHPDPSDVLEVQLLSAALGEWAGDPAVPEVERSPLADPSMLDRPLTDAHLANLSRRDLRLLRNTVFARRGRAFKSPILQQYFAQKVWYEVDPAYTDSRLTEVDKANVATIVALEQSLGGMLSDEEHKSQMDAEAEAFAGA